MSENGEGAVVLIIWAASLKKNLLRDDVVADKHRGVDTCVLRHATITPAELRARSLCVMEAPVRGYKRKISVQAFEP